MVQIVKKIPRASGAAPFSKGGNFEIVKQIPRAFGAAPLYKGGNFEIVKNCLTIPGPVGSLEAILETPNTTPSNTLVILCHPHPLHGGTFNNKVITTLARVCTDLGHRALRFNYRGVLKSEGVYGNIEGEVEDALSIIDWAQTEIHYEHLWLMGFSFGAYIAARAAIVRPTEQLVNIAPAVKHAHFDTLPPIPCPWLIIQGDQDEIIPPQAVFDFCEMRPEKPTLMVMEGATHFFHGQLITLKQLLLHYFSTN